MDFRFDQSDDWKQGKRRHVRGLSGGVFYMDNFDYLFIRLAFGLIAVCWVQSINPLRINKTPLNTSPNALIAGQDMSDNLSTREIRRALFPQPRAPDGPAMVRGLIV